jgi:hypothetical protein
MNSVSLVCTVHEESGCASVAKLHAILERIQPEVIFLEVPPAAFDDYYENPVDRTSSVIWRCGPLVKLATHQGAVASARKRI